MSGLLALLDDVAGIAKIAAASVDDVAGQAAKAGAKAAGAVIDDAAVTPKYVHGFAAARELPIVGKIALGSIRNKLVFLLPAALILSAFAPGAITPLLMLGGAYLSFEGAEKVLHALRPAHGSAALAPEPPTDPAHLEEAKVSGAVKTDFILSAEIMTIALAALPAGGSVRTQALALALVGIGITAVVYGGVALIVKADDIGLFFARRGRWSLTRALGRGLVGVMPGFLQALMIVGTAAMLWVGGSILTHGASELGLGAPYDAIHHLAEAVAHMGPEGAAAGVAWTVTALCDGIVALLLGAGLVAGMNGLVAPLLRLLKRR
ncbi:DUF808 domain-containing protein [Rhodobacter maris]|uniref:Inner membrane protein YedI n=1 Tax=Rhodobacter maris TaxID=446682 RepID=A0A285SD46_9RHOB|nr:DUF808 domain-containing protein [Rhodobacter maris]SOC05700.1 hypothetical protein SAMN05877831_104196 [Rhodobacter maris]